MSELKAIETQYKGYRFRSRLEARWAVFFDALGVEWEYEKEGFDLGEAGWYLPDFWLPAFSSFCEIKPRKMGNSADTIAKTNAMQAAGSSILLLMGTPGDEDQATLYDGISPHCCWAQDDPASVWHLHTPEPCSNKVSCRLIEDGPESPVGFPDTWGELLVCPVCGFEYVHFDNAVNTSCDDGSAWRGRGSACVIPCWCEGGHAWNLRLGFHKGNSFLAHEDAHSHADPLLVLARGDHERLGEAISAAKQARFEHGECG